MTDNKTPSDDSALTTDQETESLPKNDAPAELDSKTSEVTESASDDSNQNGDLSETDKITSSSDAERQESSSETPKVKEPRAQKTESSGEKTKKKSGFGKVLLVLVVVLVSVVGVGAGLWYWTNEKFTALQAEIASSSESEAESVARMSNFESTTNSLNAKLQQAETESSSLKNQIEYLQQKVDSQNLRILAMSTTSREDWLLAEAEYLLKLANQRILVERNAETAIGLLEEADAILRDMADPDLFPIRKAIKSDLVALKLAEKIDIEGLYLELSALSDTVAVMPLVPESFKFEEDDGQSEIIEDAEESTFSKFLNTFSSYVRVIDHNDKPAAILPPDATKYLHLNLQFMLERAQIAVLREQQEVYTENLQRAKRWVQQYFPNSSQANQFVAQLEALSNKQIIVTLPDISNSLELLHGYIATLHALGETDKPNSQPAIESTGSDEAAAENAPDTPPNSVETTPVDEAI